MGGLFSSFSDSFDFEFADEDLGNGNLGNDIGSFVKLLKRCKGRITVITGAGISSGQLPTFRSTNNDGLWDVLKSQNLQKSHFYENPLPSWRLSANVRNLQLNGVLRPTLSHRCLHYLLQKGYLNEIITQNVDCLHNFRDDHVIELHGSVNGTGLCERCRQYFPVDYTSILQTQTVPHCPLCSSVLKPPVAFFEDPITKDVRDASSRVLMNSEVLVLVGTHCAVDPVLSMAQSAKRAGMSLVEINISATQASNFMDIVLTGTSDDIFKQIGKILFPEINLEEDNLDPFLP